MTSERKNAANRENAKKSSGPRTVRGKQWSSRNALSHGLAISIGSIAALRVDIDDLASIIGLATGEQSVSAFSRLVAEAELDLARIKRCRTVVYNRYFSAPLTTDACNELNESLAPLERYERRAFSKRARAFRAIK